jgi:hypothetical protein
MYDALLLYMFDAELMTKDKQSNYKNCFYFFFILPVDS